MIVVVLNTKTKHMKKIIFILSIMAMFALGVSAQNKKDGTPDMRYKSNKESYQAPTPSYTPKSNERNYNNGGQYKIQKGYQKSNGTYVAPHIKTTPDNKKWNNVKQKK